MKVRIRRIDKSLPLPEYHTEGAVAFDLYISKDVTLEAGELKLLPTNLIIEVPAGHMLMLAARSGLSKRGLRFSNGVGIIDQDYHGPEDELHLLVTNFSKAQVDIKRGDRLGQGIIVPIERAEWEEVDALGKKTRGGFGTTGH